MSGTSATYEDGLRAALEIARREERKWSEAAGAAHDRVQPEFMLRARIAQRIAEKIEAEVRAIHVGD